MPTPPRLQLVPKKHGFTILAAPDAVDTVRRILPAMRHQACVAEIVPETIGGIAAWTVGIDNTTDWESVRAVVRVIQQNFPSHDIVFRRERDTITLAVFLNDIVA